MKKTYPGIYALLAGIAMTAAMCHGNTVSAADRISADDIVIDYATQTLKVTTKDDEVMVAFPTVKLVDDEISDVQVKKWDIYDTDYMHEVVYPEDTYEVTIDLSSINIAKGGYVAVKTNTTNSIDLIHFGGVHNKLSASYDLSEGIVTIIDKEDDNNECESLFEYRTQCGSWQDYDSDEVSLRGYEQQGATLYFREKCGYDDGEEYISSGALSRGGTIADKIGVLDAAPDFVLYEAVNTFAGKELKVKIPKLKDGPTVKMNYAKRTITVKKNTEYRQDTSSAFRRTPSNQSVEVSIGDEAGILEVRTAAVMGKKYTPASKIARYEYPASRKLAITEDATGYLGKKAEKLTMTYNSKSKKVDCSSVDLNNTYLIYVVKTGEKAPVAGDKVTATVKPAASASKARVVSLALSKLPTGSKVYVAYAADTKGKQWATTPVLLGTVE